MSALMDGRLDRAVKWVRAHIKPVKIIAATPNFLRIGICKAQIGGKGSKTRYKSLMTLIIPCANTIDLVSVHCADPRALRYEN